MYGQWRIGQAERYGWPAWVWKLLGRIFSTRRVRAAVEGVAAVVHCAYGTDPRAARATTVDGTGIFASGACGAVKQVVHISTIGVHSYSPPPNVTEDSPCVKSRDDYCNAKIEAEQVVRNICPTAILRMGNIYGPWSLPWTVRPLAHIGEGKASVVDSGQHASNMVFIDNAVEAIRLSLATERAAAKHFLLPMTPAHGPKCMVPMLLG